MTAPRHTADGTVATVTCDDGRTLNANPSWTCGQQGQWLDVVTNDPVPELECMDECAKTNGVIQYATDLPKGFDTSSCTLSAAQKVCTISSCLEGNYIKSGSSAGTIECDDSGAVLLLKYTASDSDPITCTVNDVCSTASSDDLPENFPNDVHTDFTGCGLSDSDLICSDAANFACDPGTELTGTGSLDCAPSDGTVTLSYTGSFGCAAVQCESMPDIANGQCSATSESYPASASCVCEDGYEAAADVTSLYDCGVDGQYGDITFACVGVASALAYHWLP